MIVSEHQNRYEMVRLASLVGESWFQSGPLCFVGITNTITIYTPTLPVLSTTTTLDVSLTASDASRGHGILTRSSLIFCLLTQQHSKTANSLLSHKTCTLLPTWHREQSHQRRPVALIRLLPLLHLLLVHGSILSWQR